MIRGYRFFNTEDFAAYLAVETARQLLQRGEPAQRTGFATQTKPSFAG